MNVGRDAVCQNREDRHAERFRRFHRDPFGQDAVDGKAQIGVLLGAAEGNDGTVIRLQVFFHLKPVHVADFHEGFSSLVAMAERRRSMTGKQGLRGLHADPAHSGTPSPADPPATSFRSAPHRSA